jgi:beta-glucosidase
MEKEFELAQESVRNVNTNNDYIFNENMINLCRNVVQEGCVLLKNNNNLLPLNNEKVSLFGRCQINSFHVGYGSGGDVNYPYKVSILDGLKNAGCNLNQKLVDIYTKWCGENIPNDGEWGCWPLCYDEKELTDEVILECANESDVAIVIIGRSAGEDRDIKLEDGSWYLNENERNLLSSVRKYFNKMCVIINSGSIMDITGIEEYNPDALMYIWQGGQEFGNGVADVIMGIVSPSGKLTDTIAKIEDYPSTKYMYNPDYSEYVEDIYVGYRYFNTFAKDKIIYPFGYGLTYSNFKIDALNITNIDKKITGKLLVKNIGNYKGKEVVQIYLSKPQGLLGNPSVELVWYKKTKELEVNEEEILEINIDLLKFASFDDTNITGYMNSFVLENGNYKLLVGFDSIDLKELNSFTLDNSVLVKECNEACAPNKEFKRIINKNGINYENVVLGKANIKERILNSLKDNNHVNNTYYNFNDVLNEKITLDEFVNSLDESELEALTRGSLYSMNSPYGPLGNAGTLAASFDKLFERNIPSISTNDGPSGVRLKATSTLVPNGVAMASTFNNELIEELCYYFGKEVKERKSHILLAPGINIHRNPLCGRNFEYYSEDPYLTGMIASSYVRGIQKANASACPKHFACNNQEFNRHVHDSLISQRALREIYLKGFEICVKEANPDVIMTSYNKINGEYTYYSFDLVNLILKTEWKYKGLVITDWWMRSDKSKIFDNLETQAYRVRAGVDVYMPGSTGSMLEPGESDGTLLNSLHKNGITLSEIRSSAKRVLELCVKHSK